MIILKMTIRILKGYRTEIVVFLRFKKMFKMTILTYRTELQLQLEVEVEVEVEVSNFSLRGPSRGGLRRPSRGAPGGGPKV
jgi:hypothetical protein